MDAGMNHQVLTRVKVNHKNLKVVPQLIVMVKLFTSDQALIKTMVDLLLSLVFTILVLFRFLDACPERASGSEMDEQRKQQMAYQYLCHLEEAKM